LDGLPAGLPVLLHGGHEWPDGLGEGFAPVLVDLPLPGDEKISVLLGRIIYAWPDHDGLVLETARRLIELDAQQLIEIRRVLVPEFVEPQVARNPDRVLAHFGAATFLALLDTGSLWRPTSQDPHRFTHAELMRATFEPVRYRVEGLLPAEGLAVLAGKPKIGKSWGGLQLAVSVAAGTQFLGRKVEQGSVLALFLEDTPRRLKERLLLQRADQALPITFLTRFQKLDQGGSEELAQEIRACEPSLVIVDTIATATSGKFDENDAAQAGAVFNQLREMAQDCHVLVLAVMHHGKGVRGEAGMDIRGSSAVPGAADVNIGIYREDGQHTLKAEGRDIEAQELRVEFDAGRTFAWHLVGDARELARGEAETEILETMNALGGKGDVEAITKALGKDRTTVQRHLKRMFEDGRLDRHAEGQRLIYSRPADGSAPTPPDGRTPHTPRTDRGASLAWPSRPAWTGVQAVRGVQGCPEGC